MTNKTTLFLAAPLALNLTLGMTTTASALGYPHKPEYAEATATTVVTGKRPQPQFRTLAQQDGPRARLVYCQRPVVNCGPLSFAASQLTRVPGRRDHGNVN